MELKTSHIDMVRRFWELSMNGRPGVVRKIAEAVGCTTQTVRNVMHSTADAGRLTDIQRKVILEAAKVAKPYMEQSNQFAQELNDILQ